MTRIGKLIDVLGELRQREAETASMRQDIERSVRKALARRKGRHASGAKYRAALVIVRRVEIADLAGLARAVGPKRFLSVARVGVADARRVLGDDGLRPFVRNMSDERLEIKEIG